jgi:hypothetical protein
MKTKISYSIKFALSLLSALLLCLPVIAAERGQPRGGPEIRGGQQFHGSPGGNVQRFNHGSVRGADSHVFRAPSPTFYGTPGRFEAPHNFGPRHDVFVHRDVDIDVHGPRAWDNFGFHRHLSVLPPGFLTLNIGGAPYYYSDGMYYQPAEGGFQEVYPPAGAEIPGPPDGAIQVYAGGQTYYYAGGAFYIQQPDGQFVLTQPPIGVVVPELPPGATEVNVNGQIAYQFNGVYYQPVFVDGVTQYQTVTP